MKKFMQNRGHFVTALVALLFSVFLIACGGGGGGSTPVVTPPTPVTYTETANVVCPDKTAQSATATASTQAEAQANAVALANAKCAAVTGSISITDSVSVDTLFANGFSTTTVGSSQVPNVDNVKLVVGATEVGATVPLTLSSFTPTSFLNKLTAKPAPGTYTYVANLVDGLGRPFKIVKTFTVVPVSVPFSCAFPMVKHVSKDACIYPIGVQKVVPAVELATSMTQVTDSAFLAATASGEAYLVDVGIKMTNTSIAADRDRALVYAVYRQNGNYYLKPLFKDTLTSAVYEDRLTTGALFGSIFDRFQGDSSGLFVRFQPNNLGALSIWDAVNHGFSNIPSSNGPVWN